MAAASLTPAEIIAKFTAIHARFVTTLSDVYPECEATRAAAEAARDMVDAPVDVQEAAMRAWNTDMKKVWDGASYYQHVHARNGAMFQRADDLAFLSTLDFWAKWCDADLDDESRDSLWIYLDQLNKYARFFCLVPRNLLDKASAIFTKYVDVTEDGTFAFAPGFDIMRVRDELIADIGGEGAVSQDELKNMASLLKEMMGDMLGPNNERLPDMLKMVGLGGVDAGVASTILAQATQLVGGMPQDEVMGALISNMGLMGQLTAGGAQPDLSALLTQFMQPQ
jgi:hypothetical protein